MSKKLKVYVAGHRGMVGSAIVRVLKDHEELDIITRKHSELDLTNQAEVREFFDKERPDQVYLAAAKVGGIYANNVFPAEFIYQNIMIESNVIHQAWKTGVKKLLFLGSSCIYPKLAPQPMAEDALLAGELEPTNEPYAIAKIAGIKLCESYNRQYGEIDQIDYRSVMPTNLYGPGDNYHPMNSHVIPALIRRFHEAKVQNLLEVSIWGSGNPLREFLFVDDMASACYFVMNENKSSFEDLTDYRHNHINVGSGEEISIRDLALLLKEIIGFKGKVIFDMKNPDGAPRKFMDSSKLLRMGWKPIYKLKTGLKTAYNDFVENYKDND